MTPKYTYSYKKKNGLTKVLFDLSNWCIFFTTSLASEVFFINTAGKRQFMCCRLRRDIVFALRGNKLTLMFSYFIFFYFTTLS